MNASCLTFVTNADYASLFAMEIEKLLANDKITTLCETRRPSNRLLVRQITSPKHFLKSYKQQNCLAYKFSNPRIAICYNLVQVCPSAPPFVSAVLFIPYFRACFHGGGVPQVGEVTRLGGVTHLPGVPHLHVNRPLMLFLCFTWFCGSSRGLTFV